MSFIIQPSTSGGSSGGGKEPYIDDTFVNTVTVNDSLGSTFTQEHNANQSYVLPFMLQQDVTLKQVAITQTNSNSIGTLGYLGLYEYSSKTASTFTFDKVYQESQTFDVSGTLANSIQRITLTTAQTLEAGKIYVVAVIHADSIGNVAQRPNYFGYRQLKQNKILGNLATSSVELYRSLVSVAATPVAGVLPASITYVGQSNTNASKGGFYTLTLQNV